MYNDAVIGWRNNDNCLVEWHALMMTYVDKCPKANSTRLMIKARRRWARGRRFQCKTLESRRSKPRRRWWWSRCRRRYCALKRWGNNFQGTISRQVSENVCKVSLKECRTRQAREIRLEMLIRTMRNGHVFSKPGVTTTREPCRDLLCNFRDTQGVGLFFIWAEIVKSWQASPSKSNALDTWMLKLFQVYTTTPKNNKFIQGNTNCASNHQYTALINLAMIWEESLLMNQCTVLPKGF